MWRVKALAATWGLRLIGHEGPWASNPPGPGSSAWQRVAASGSAPGLASLSLEETATLRPFPRFPETDPASLAPGGRRLGALPGGPLGRLLLTLGVGPARATSWPRASAAGSTLPSWGLAREKPLILGRPEQDGVSSPAQRLQAGMRWRLGRGAPALRTPHSEAGLSAWFSVSSRSWGERPFASHPPKA